MATDVEMYEGRPVFLAANSKELKKAVKNYEGAAEAPYVVKWSGKTGRIREDAFYSDDTVGVIIVPDTVTYIGKRAFYSCENLTKAILPESVSYIESEAFCWCEKLCSVNLPKSLGSLSPSLFRACKELKEIDIPDSILTIYNRVFLGCSALTRITIPKSVRYIEEYAFDSCAGLEEIHVHPSNPVFDSREGCNAIIDSKTDTLIVSCKATVIPHSVREIGESAFEGQETFTTIEIPDSVAKIGYRAFKNCVGLSEIVIPDSVTTIEDCAFEGCKALKSAVLPKSLKILDGIFFRCSGLTEIVIPESVTVIDGGAFSCCTSLSEITIPDTVKQIGYSAFKRCTGLVRMAVPDSVEEIGHSAFEGCSNLTEIVLPPSLSSIEDYTFQGCAALKGVTIPESVTEIGDEAFSGCVSLTEIVLPDSVKKIGRGAFSGCTGLVEMTLPASLVEMGRGLFDDCTGLVSIKVSKDNPKFDSRDDCNAIIETSTNTLVAGYAISAIPDSVEKIGEYAFGGARLAALAIPDSVTELDDCAFKDCSALESVSFGKSLKRIGWSTFAYCKGLASIDIPDSVTEISNAAFCDCTGLKRVHVGDSVTTIGHGCDGAFQFCSNLAEVHLGRSVTRIGYKAFLGCSSLETINIPESTKVISNYAFNGCSSLKSITIPDSVEHIDDEVFKGCSSLEVVYSRKPWLLQNVGLESRVRIVTGDDVDTTRVQAQIEIGTRSIIFDRHKPFQRRIKDGDSVEITLVGAREYPGDLNTWNPVWEMDDTVSVVFEEYYFNVLVNGKKRYIGKQLLYRYTESSSMGGVGRLDVERDRINAASQERAIDKFISWMQRGHADNDDWHFLKKPEEVKDIPDGLPYYTVPKDTTPDAPLGPKYVILDNPVHVDGVAVYGKRFDYGSDKLAKAANTAARQVIALAFRGSAQYLDWEEDCEFGSRKPFHEFIDCIGRQYAVLPATDSLDGLDDAGLIVDKALYDRLASGGVEWVEVE